MQKLNITAFATLLLAVAACGRTGLLEDGEGGGIGGGSSGTGGDDGGRTDAADGSTEPDALDPDADPPTVHIGGKSVPNVQQIVAGESHACLRDKKSRVFCWGVNEQGQLGNGTTNEASTAVRVEGLPEIVRLASGQHHVCALGVDQTVWCWGEDIDGQLGNGKRLPLVATPQRVTGIVSPPVAIAANGWHTCVLDAAGTLSCWGRNTSGECGVLGSDRFLTPVPVPAFGEGLTALALGTWHTCVVLADTSVRCVGRNADGQLGMGGTGPFETLPQTARDLSGASALMAGDDHTCAILRNGNMMCWGDGFLGELGNGTGQGNSTPTPLPNIKGAIHAAGGLEHTCAVLGNGVARCWGKGLQGQLGNSDTPLMSSLPMDVRGIHDAVQVAAGSSFSCIAHADHGAACWGASANGELGHGLGDDEFQTTPVEVQGL